MPMRGFIPPRLSASEHYEDSIYCGIMLLDRWRTAKVGNRIMPGIEAAHIGPIPTAVFISAFIARQGASELEPVDLSAQAGFENDAGADEAFEVTAVFNRQE